MEVNIDEFTHPVRWYQRSLYYTAVAFCGFSLLCCVVCICHYYVSLKKARQYKREELLWAWTDQRVRQKKKGQRDFSVEELEGDVEQEIAPKESTGRGEGVLRKKERRSKETRSRKSSGTRKSSYRPRSSSSAPTFEGEGGKKLPPLLEPFMSVLWRGMRTSVVVQDELRPATIWLEGTTLKFQWEDLESESLKRVTMELSDVNYIKFGDIMGSELDMLAVAIGSNESKVIVAATDQSEQGGLYQGLQLLVQAYKANSL